MVKVRDWPHQPLSSANLPPNRLGRQFNLNAAALKKYKEADPRGLRNECNFSLPRSARRSVAELSLHSASRVQILRVAGCLERYQYPSIGPNGYTLIEIKGGGYSVVELKGNGYT